MSVCLSVFLSSLTVKKSKECNLITLLFLLSLLDLFLFCFTLWLLCLANVAVLIITSGFFICNELQMNIYQICIFWEANTFSKLHVPLYISHIGLLCIAMLIMQGLTSEQEFIIQYFYNYLNRFR